MNVKNQYIKTCSVCNSCWRSLDDLLHDDALIFNGYQPSFKNPEKGCFLFTHDKEGCGTTLSVEIKNFTSLLGPDVELLPYTPKEDPNCELRCVEEADLEPCAAEICNGTTVRELMQIIKKHIRTPSGSLSEDEIDRIIACDEDE